MDDVEMMGSAKGKTQGPGRGVAAITPAYVKQKAAAAYLGVSVRYFQRHVDVRPKELPGRGQRPVLVWAIADLDAWVARVSDPKSRRTSRRKA